MHRIYGSPVDHKIEISQIMLNILPILLYFNSSSNNVLNEICLNEYFFLVITSFSTQPQQNVTTSSK